MSWRKIGFDSFYVTGSTIAIQGLSWVILASIARVDGAKELGIYTLAQAIALPLQYLSWLSIRQRFLIIPDDEIPADFIFLRLFFPLFVFLAALAVIYVWLSDKYFAWIAGLVFISKYVEGLYDIIYAVMQKANRSKNIALLSISRSLVSGAVFVASYVLTRNLLLALFCTFTQQCLVFAYVLKGKKDLKGRIGVFSSSRLTRIAALTSELLPITLSLVVMSLNSSAPRVLIEGILGSKELGYFAAVNMFVSLGTIVVGSVGQALLQPLARAVRDNAQRSFWLQLSLPACGVFGICAVGALTSIVIGRLVLALVFGSAFVNITPLLTTASLASAPVFSASVLSNGVLAAYLRRPYLLIQMAGVSLNCLLVVLLAPVYGLSGIYLAFGFSGFAQMFLSVAVIKTYWSRRILSVSSSAA